jgi:hypothetical protein
MGAVESMPSSRFLRMVICEAMASLLKDTERI